MSDTTVAEPPATIDDSIADVCTESTTNEHKLPGVWGKVYEKTSKEGKPAVFGRIRRYRKIETGYEDTDFINTMTDCDNLIEVAYEVKKFMREFYADRDA